MIAAVAALLPGFRRLPPLGGRSRSMSSLDTADTRLGRAIVPVTQSHPGTSGVFPLRDGRDAFAARILLADAADKTLDVQYYIWHDDMSGTLLAAALRRAADRSVRVRLLLDDNNTSGLDARIAALDVHPNVEVRLFNPFKHRRWRVLDYLTDFARLNRRMHNKSFTADNQATIIGGRNVGDEYFDAGQESVFVDLDVLAVGPVVNDVSHDFDRYWVSESSYPADRLLPAASPASIADVMAAASKVARSPDAMSYMGAIEASPLVRDLVARRLPLEWAVTRMVSDDPVKGLGRAKKDEHLWARLERVLEAPTRELELVSAYFVPGKEGVKAFTAMARRGVRIAVLTNSLEATDVAFVHAGYAKRRKALIRAGIALYEMKRAVPVAVHRERGRFGGSSSGSSLHAKTFSVDRTRVFIGSFNFDPRSARLNTELGFVIESPALARAVAQAFAEAIPRRSYRLRLGEDGELVWVEQDGGREVAHDKEPGAGFWLKLGISVLSRLPIEWLL
jgi:putative cardiolipin synthase